MRTLSSCMLFKIKISQLKILLGNLKADEAAELSESLRNAASSLNVIVADQ
jgi:hypothetical protein